MSDRETIRDSVHGALTPELVQQRESAGWRLVAVEWERGSGSRAGIAVDTPYGLRIAGDCAHLEEHPEEREVLRTVMQGVVNDRPLSAIAEELNRRGFRTRAGALWNPAVVFDLMPAVIDSSPRIFAEADWSAMRRA